MFSFNRISVKQILVFSETINELSVLQKELIEKRYLENAENFDKTLEFLKQLDLIDIKENRVIPEPDFKPLLVDLKKCQNQYLLIQQFIIEVFINRKNLFSKYTSEFISKFCLLNEKYQFKPNTLERLKYSDLRNFLIDLGFIYLDLNENGENRYVISDDYLYNYIGFKESYEVSLDEFEKIMEKKKEIGVAAELKIIQYEKNRLSEFPYLIEKIEHISIKDVTAGYDIKSFEGKFDDNNNPIPRYIEVKAVSYWDYKLKKLNFIIKIIIYICYQ
jgi:hypothetical protein